MLHKVCRCGTITTDAYPQWCRLCGWFTHPVCVRYHVKE